MTNCPKLGFIYASEDDTTTTTTGVEGIKQQQQQQQHTTPASGMLMSTVPIASATEIFRHFVRHCEPIWCHRHTLTVTGSVYDVGDFRVRVGELRQMQPQARVRGTIMEIEWRGPSVISTALASSSSLLASSHHDNDNNNNDDNNTGVDAVDMMDITNAAETSTTTNEQTPYIPTEAEINTEYTQIAHLIGEFWRSLGINQYVITDKKHQASIRESILVPDVGREVKIKLSQRRQQQQEAHEGDKGGQEGWRKRENRRRQKRREAIALDRSWGGGGGGMMPEKQSQEDEEEDLTVGVDLARQYMELFRFNR